jgi:hypothetical protein
VHRLEDTLTMPRQQNIPGTERPSHPELDEAADALVEAQQEAKALREQAKNAVDAAHATLVQRMLDAKVARYKYRDAEGDVCLVELDVPEPKATVKKTGERDVEVGQGVETPGDRVDAADRALADVNAALDDRVEKRRVRRTAEHDAAVDPFAGTRGAMKGSILEQAAAAQDRAQGDR